MPYKKRAAHTHEGGCGEKEGWKIAKLSKDSLIKREKKRLLAIFQKLEKDKLDTAESLIENAAFMTITLKELSKTINEKGCVSEYQNGENQWGTKKSPEVEVYNAMVKNYTMIVKTLCDMLPESNPEASALLQFIGGQRK